MENVNSWPLDYRVSESIKDCSTIYDVKKLLRETYAEHVTAEFSHITNEDERIWLHDNFERIMNKSEVNDSEKIKAL